MGLFTKNDSREILDKYLKKYINEDILFDGKKKDDEDDMAFRQRCFLMGVHMLKSGKKQNLKRK